MKSFTNESDVDSDVRVSRPVQVLERLAHNLFLGQWEVLDETLPWKVDEKDEDEKEDEDEKDDVSEDDDCEDDDCEDDDCEDDDCSDYQAVGKSDLKRGSEIVVGQTLLNLDHFFYRVAAGGKYIGLAISIGIFLWFPDWRNKKCFHDD